MSEIRRVLECNHYVLTVDEAVDGDLELYTLLCMLPNGTRGEVNADAGGNRVSAIIQ